MLHNRLNRRSDTAPPSPILGDSQKHIGLVEGLVNNWASPKTDYSCAYSGQVLVQVSVEVWGLVHWEPWYNYCILGCGGACAGSDVGLKLNWDNSCKQQLSSISGFSGEQGTRHTDSGGGRWKCNLFFTRAASWSYIEAKIYDTACHGLLRLSSNRFIIFRG